MGQTFNTIFIRISWFGRKPDLHFFNDVIKHLKRISIIINITKSSSITQIVSRSPAGFSIPSNHLLSLYHHGPWRTKACKTIFAHFFQSCAFLLQVLFHFLSGLQASLPRPSFAPPSTWISIVYLTKISLHLSSQHILIIWLATIHQLVIFYIL